LGAELVERPERVIDGGAEVAGRLVATVRRQVLPPDGVVDVATQMEGQVLLVQEDRAVVVFGPCLLQLGDGIVHAFDVSGVVLAVVDLVDLTGDMRFQRCVVPVQIGQRVFGHVVPFVDDRIVLRSFATVPPRRRPSVVNPAL
jgi:hypothetical protein